MGEVNILSVEEIESGISRIAQERQNIEEMVNQIQRETSQMNSFWQDDLYEEAKQLLDQIVQQFNGSVSELNAMENKMQNQLNILKTK